MPLDYDHVMGLPAQTIASRFTERDTMLYALGIGAGMQDSLDAEELKFVYEDGLKALPTQAVVMAYPGFWLSDPKYGLDRTRILHGEQMLKLHAPLPVKGEIKGILTIDEIYDKGKEKGAILYSRREIYDNTSGDHLATIRQSSFLRGDGGFSGSVQRSPAFLQPVPDNQAPDFNIEMATSANQALIYRLNGDYNPLHADPSVAQEAGFPRPILHGLCTYGIVGRAVLKTLCRNAPDRLKTFDVRFTKPVFPGETISVEIWKRGRGEAALRARVRTRDAIVLDNGFIGYDPL